MTFTDVDAFATSLPGVAVGTSWGNRTCGFFTIPHFQGYPAILIALRVARTKDVRHGSEASVE
jgi:hypothetical protein